MKSNALKVALTSSDKGKQCGQSTSDVNATDRYSFAPLDIAKDILSFASLNLNGHLISDSFAAVPKMYTKY